MRVALLQQTASDDPDANLAVTLRQIEQAVDEGADAIFTPEVTNCVSLDRGRQARVLQAERDDETLAALRAICARRGVWLNIGSLALKADPASKDRRFRNRSFVIGPDGEVRARYDKMHLFDVEVSPQETYRESAGYAPGDHAVMTKIASARVGLTICYDLRFPALFHAYAKNAADVVTVPSAFSPATGEAHWHVLLRARAIETGCFIIAAAQCGTHSSASGQSRRTYGHSLIVSPWGDILADGGKAPGIVTAHLDLSEVENARRRIPSVGHARDITLDA